MSKFSRHQGTNCPVIFYTLVDNLEYGQLGHFLLELYRHTKMLFFD